MRNSSIQNFLKGLVKTATHLTFSYKQILHPQLIIVALRDHFACVPIKYILKEYSKTLLVVQWIRILLMQGHRFDHWPGKIPHAAGQPSPCTAPQSPWASSPCSTIKRTHYNEKPTYNKSISTPRPLLDTTRESPCTTKTQCCQK